MDQLKYKLLLNHIEDEAYNDAVNFIDQIADKESYVKKRDILDELAQYKLNLYLYAGWICLIYSQRCNAITK